MGSCQADRVSSMKDPSSALRIDQEARALAGAKSAMQNRQPREAWRLLAPWIDRPTARADVLVVAAHAQLVSGARTVAATTIERALKAGAGTDALLIKGLCLSGAGQTDAACEVLRRCLGDARVATDAACALATALEVVGRIDEAESILAPIIASNKRHLPDVTQAWARVLLQRKRFDELQSCVADTLADLGTTLPEARRALWYLRAKAYDRSGQFDAAMDAAVRANQIGEMDFDPAIFKRQSLALAEQWTRQRMSRFPQSRCTSEIPVFVAGMPRSGTSLIDQVIDAHPLAAGVGELNTIEKFARQLEATVLPGVEPPACFGAIQADEWTRKANEYVTLITAQSPHAQRIVNKALGNNRLLGMIASLFPKTRIIHALRDPRDTAISCLMGGFNNRLFPWTTRLEWVACAWQESRRIMDHWKHSLDVPILDVSYERLVQYPQSEFPRIIEFLGLEWDEACTRFHESKRTVRTLSYDQVNRPLYTSSVARHTNYAAALHGIDWPPYEANDIR